MGGPSLPPQNAALAQGAILGAVELMAFILGGAIGISLASLRRHGRNPAVGRIGDQRRANVGCNFGLALLQAKLGHVVMHVGVGSRAGCFRHRQLALGVVGRFLGREERLVARALWAVLKE